MSEAVFLELIALGKIVAILIGIVVIVALLLRKQLQRIHFEFFTIAKFEVVIDTNVGEDSNNADNVSK